MVSRLDEDSFLSGANATFVAELYERYLKNAASVDPAWSRFFAGMGDEERAVLQDFGGATWAPRRTKVIGNGTRRAAVPEADLSPARFLQLDPATLRAATLDSIRALMMIRVFRVRGHLIADLDPLGIERVTYHPELDPATYGFTEADYDRKIFIDNVLGMETATVREILTALKATYCDKIGVEFMHIQDPDKKSWIQQRVEGPRNQTDFTVRGRRTILERITASETFERFLDRKYTGTKRFGLEGGESLIPAIEQIMKRGGQLGLKEVVLGMSHRGRLNVLTNVMLKPYAAIFSEFHGNTNYPDEFQGSGDVKYHLGASADRDFDDSVIHLSLAANPSHLEAVDSVVLGKVRAKQAQRGDTEREQVLGILLHGDAAFAGQGLVGETLDLSELRGYRTGGTIHIVVNNQIGFTTSPVYSRSSPYPSDVAKKVQAPIFHVNGDDPEAVVHVARIAAEYRQTFKSDIVIDMFCYRRFGHNEADEPSFTQPKMYRTIAEHPTTRDIYAQRLIQGGIITPEESDEIVATCERELEAAFEASEGYKPNKTDWLERAWKGIETGNGCDRNGSTGVEIDLLREVGRSLTRTPAAFHPHRKMVRLFKTKSEAIEKGENVDWATAEALAFGCLLCEGKPVRLSGQDSGRGTFSQRHAVLVDQESEERYVPLNNIRAGQASFEVVDSPLSEAGVLGFEYGYTATDPHSLVMWEAQFGDFANGAQVIVDQFIASGEVKWFRMSGLVMLLPHGFEGQGPEHSSARPERYLQLCAEENIQVANCTTPANYFHLLRRQLHRKFRKPLIMMTPKSLLRHKQAVSCLEDMGPGTHFEEVLPETGRMVAAKKVRRIVLCSGKVYFDLLAERESRGIRDIALIRVEQLYPLPAEALAKQFAKYPGADLVWCQEEPRNMGAWSFIDRRLEDLMSEVRGANLRPNYAGRPEAASPATGSFNRHVREQKALVDAALTLD